MTDNVQRVYAKIENAVGNLTAEETAQLAAGIFNLISVDRNSVFDFLDNLSAQDAIEFFDQASAYIEEKD